MTKIDESTMRLLTSFLGMSNLNNEPNLKKYYEAGEILNECKLKYDRGEETVMDDVYDGLRQVLLEHENLLHEDEVLNDEDNPFKQVGTFMSDVKIEHFEPMLSIKDVFNTTDAYKFVSKHKEDIVEQDKLDGVAGSFLINEGRIVHCVTRGDGLVGSDITLISKRFLNIPTYFDYKKPIEVRGELIIMKDDFEEINRGRETPYKNSRNLVAGSLSLLDPKEVAKRKIRFVAHGLGHNELNLNTVEEEMEFLKDMGFRTVRTTLMKQTTLDDLDELYFDAIEARNNLPHDIDGIVLKINSKATALILGHNNHHPRHQIALKLPAEIGHSKLKYVTWQVGMNSITPVAVFEPTELSGSTVVRATLHNIRLFRRLNLEVGSNVDIIKSGDIIPKMIGASPSHLKNPEPIYVPTKCPECDGEVEEDEVELRCINPKCIGKFKRKMERFISNKYMNMKGIGEKAIRNLIDLGYITTFADLFELTEDSLKMAGYKEKTIRNFLRAINQGKDVTPERVLASMNIDSLGRTKSKRLIDALGTDIINWSSDDMYRVSGVYEKEIEAFLDWRESDYKHDYEPLLKHIDFEIKDEEKPTSTFMEGIRLAITGKFDMSRSKIEKKFKMLGASFGGISRQTDFLIIGDKASKSKIEKAESLGAKIIDLKFLDNLLEESGVTVVEF